MTTNTLALIDTAKPLEIFSNNNLDPIIEKIEKEVKAEVFDISTPDGRARIKSVAYKIGQTKNALDKMGKELVSDWKEQAKKVDVERTRAWDRLEALQKEIRQPLTDWENKDKERIAAHETAVADIRNLVTFLEEPTSAEIERRIAKSVEISGSRNWDEFAGRAKPVHGETHDALTKKLEARKKYEAEQDELERLRREEAERKQREHEERIKAEAAEKARREAEEKDRREAEAEAARVKAEQEKAEQERQRIEREKVEAEERAGRPKKPVKQRKQKQRPIGKPPKKRPVRTRLPPSNEPSVRPRQPPSGSVTASMRNAAPRRKRLQNGRPTSSTGRRSTARRYRLCFPQYPNIIPATATRSKSSAKPL